MRWGRNLHSPPPPSPLSSLIPIVVEQTVRTLCLSVCLSVCLHLSVCTYTTCVCLSVCLSVCLCVCLSVCLSAFVCLCDCLSVCLSACLSLLTCQSICIHTLYHKCFMVKKCGHELNISPPHAGKRRKSLRHLLTAIEGENHMSDGGSKFSVGCVHVCV